MLIKLLNKHKACRASLEFCEGKTPEQAWETCERGDWLLWILFKLKFDHKIIVGICCDIAESVVHLTKGNEASNAITITRKWLIGEATIEEVKQASYAAYAAYAAAAYAAAYAAHAYAAYDAAYAAAYADADADADAAAAAADARKQKLKEYADLIRSKISLEEVMNHVS